MGRRRASKKLLSGLLIGGAVVIVAGACGRAREHAALPDAAFRVTTFPPDADVAVLIDGEWRSAHAPFVVRSASHIGEVRVGRPGYLAYTLAEPRGSLLSVELEPDPEQVSARLAAVSIADEAVEFAMLYPTKLDREFYSVLSRVMTAKAATTADDELHNVSGPTLLKSDAVVIRLDCPQPGSGRGRFGVNPLAPGAAPQQPARELFALHFLDPDGRPRMVFKRHFERPLTLDHATTSGGVLVSEQSTGTLPESPAPRYELLLGVSYRVDQTGVRILELSYRKLDSDGTTLWSVTRPAADR